MPPAARIADPTTHGGGVAPPGVPTVLVGGVPAAVLGDLTTCPMQWSPGVFHGSSVITSASSTVLVGGRPAARVGDRTGCGAVLVQGCPTVLIGG
ncbi:PAAR domain-containing protein [Ornithinimicrobium sp. W1665]|uniref:PAAR domain-containing protein n=1 Tax=Ornithinimicrobium sp. W1665 TaxID=3416666 RepID=UPI003CFABBB6